MKKAHFGRLSIGDIPRVVGTISSFAALSEFPRLGPERCDIAEVRLDLIGEDTDWLPACRTVESSGTPVILTLRTAAEGGKCTLPSEERKQIFKNALSFLSAVDVELECGLARELYEHSRNTNKALLVSYHNFDQTPSLENLTHVVSRASEFASVVKVSTMVTSAADVQTLRDLLQKEFELPLCVIGMGPLGTDTRSSFPSLGSALAYGYLDSSVAPGQVSASALIEQISKKATRDRS